jgi:hypothetical protein
MNYLRYWLPAEEGCGESIVGAAWDIDAILTVVTGYGTADRAVDGDPSSGERAAIGCIGDGAGYLSAGLRVANR